MAVNGGEPHNDPWLFPTSQCFGTQESLGRESIQEQQEVQYNPLGALD